MKPAEIAASYFVSGRVMQIASLRDGQPRVNSVYYVASNDNKYVYWMSLPERRHSMDIMKNSKVGAAIAIKTDHPVAGLQFTGIAKELTLDSEVKNAAMLYGQKYEAIASDFYERYIAGKNRHHFYKMTINFLELFDEVNFPGGEVVSVPLD